MTKTEASSYTINGHRLLLLLVVPLVLIVFAISQWHDSDRSYNLQNKPRREDEINYDNKRRRLTEQTNHHEHDLEHVLHLATRTAEDTFTEDTEDSEIEPFRVLVTVTTLEQYDKGTRGTTHGADRLKDNVLPILVDGVASMVNKGWSVDVYLICGFESLTEERHEMIQSALPDGVGLQVWTDAIPYYYVKKYNGDLKHGDQSSIELAPHGLSRQHRYVVRDKLMEYDFFTAFEDDMRIMADHVINFLEMSVEIDRMRRVAEHAPDGLAHVDEHELLTDHRTTRGKSLDKATVGNDVIQDPMTAEQLRRLWPGFVRVEVLDTRNDEPHQLLQQGVLDKPKYSEHVPASMEYEDLIYGSIDPSTCCDVPSGRARTPPNPTKEDLLLWETDISAMGVRHYPGNIGWGAAMTVEDRSDVGSYWSGEGHNFNDQKMKTRPRRVNSLIGQQAGWMATRSQILYFHEHACPGGFLPPFEGIEWVNDSLQTRNG